MEYKDLPKEIRDDIEVEIAKIENTRGISSDDLKTQFIEIFSDPSIAEYDPKTRAPYAVQVLWSLHMRKQPTTEFSLVIPFGVREKYRTRKGTNRSELLAYVQPKDEKTFMMKEIVCLDTFSNIASDLKLLVAYQNLTFESRGQGMWLEVGSDTKFKDPKELKYLPEDFFTKVIGFPKLSSLRELSQYQSKLDGNYVDRFSQFVVEAMVVRPNKGLRKDQSTYANYVVKDISLNYEEEIIEEENEVKAILPSEITIWVPPRFLIYNSRSQLGFVGTISINSQTHIPSMNAYYVYPAGIVRPMNEEGE